MDSTQKIGVLNFQYSDHNYGAVLQAAAIEQFLKSNGYNAEHIDYISSPEIKGNRVIIQLKCILKKLGLSDSVRKMLGKQVHLTPVVTNEKVFEEFRKNWLVRTKCFRNFEELKKTDFNFKAVIVGSDQVWRPSQFTRFSDYKVYFLSFLPSQVKKISYAASFGIDKWEVSDANVTNEIKKYIQDFNAVSVREDSGVNICATIFNVDAEHVLDPTLLVGSDFFNSIIAKEIRADAYYDAIVYYKLDIDQHFIDSVTILGRKKCKPVKNIYYNQVDGRNEYYSVPEWLSNIKNANFVITDSFHCVCFCLLFQKEFLCCVNESRGLSRLQSLLGMLELTDRICSSKDDFDNKLNSLKLIDYSKVGDILNKHRDISKAFLLSNLS
ncbi:polysaccharide pyruvyl transferase family protein [Escherichia coli]